MDTETNQCHDALPSLPEPLSTPKLFSMTQSMHQLENLSQAQAQKHITRGLLISNYSENSTTASPFRPNRTRGGAQQERSRPLIFPALQRFQKPQDQNYAEHLQTPQKQQLPRAPFFSLLKASGAPPVQDTSRHFFQAQSQQPEHSVERMMKREQLSVKDSSSSPPPHPQPHQMLPPPPPPDGPISRPGSRNRSRSRSQSRSSASFRNEERAPTTDFGFVGSPPAALASQSTDLPDIAIRALREVQTVSAELMEERRRTKSLLSQLNALTTAYDALKLQQSSTQQDLFSAQRLHEEQAEDAASAKKDRATALDSLALASESLASVKLELSTIIADRDILRVTLAKEKLETKTSLARIKTSMSELGDNYRSLRGAFGELKVAYDASQKLVGELRDTRAWAADKLQTLEPLLNDEGQYSRAAAVKILVGELQNEIADARRVIDLLRDKLHVLSSQLAEAQGRVRELEDDERTSLLASLRRLSMDSDEGDEASPASFGGQRVALVF
ncbi:hypothetical protein FPV67DRAFT_509029 [Lyophyllum atratum]|nr:hypothetical protein FPV67DRAFT_509029 [Lyophyllum atratum]